MTEQSRKPAKKPNIAWRIGRVFLDILGKVLLVVMIAAATLAIIGVIAGAIFMTKFSSYLKSDVIPKAYEYADNLALDDISLAQTSIIYYKDRETGEYRELQQLYASEHRIWVAYDEIPQDLVNATIAIEDKRFLEHDGVDWLRTLSAVRNFVGGDSSYGASTITQQLIKNLSHDDDVTVNRKVQEIFRAMAVEEYYSKNEIMEWYLNTIYLGEGCYGVQSAAEVYFGKNIGDLSPAECAAIVAITNNPSLYDPYINPEGNHNRQMIILSEMHAQGYLSDGQYTAAKGEEMLFHNGRYDEKTYYCASCGFDGPRSKYSKQDGAYYCPNCGTQNYAVDDNNAYSYFVDTIYRDVVNDLCEKYDLSELAAVQKLLTGGYSIYATIDPSAQEIIDRVYENPDNVPDTVSTQQLQSAIVLIDNATGDIIAMSGGVGEKTNSLSLNRATQSKLPTGSSIKPISVYAPALDMGVVTPATVFDDAPFYEGSSWPQNDSRTYSGHCTVQRGVTSSLNTISVRTLNALGLDNSYNFLTQKMGITTLVQDMEIGGQHYSDIAYAPLALGELTFGLTVREMTQAYATFPNGGTFREARTYTQVVDPEGKVILDNQQESHTAISEKANFYINNLLRDAVSYGTGTPAYKNNVAVAGKTGTSGNNQSRWFAGYTPYYTAVVWCGYDEPEQVILSNSWTNPAITMWRQVMDPLHQNLEYRDFPYADMGWYSICADCGKLATEACKKDVRDGSSRVVSIRLFGSDVPQSYCKCHVIVKVCKESGKIANEFCEHCEGNEVEEVGMILKEFAWSQDVKNHCSFIYDPEDKAAVCTVHTADSTVESTEEGSESTELTEETSEPPEDTTEPATEPPTDPPTEPPADPDLFLPPQEEDDWFRRKAIV